MATPDSVHAKAKATYNAAADFYDDPANSFWDRFGRRTIERLGTHPIPSPEAWWSAVLGTGYRGTVEQLDAHDRERVRMANLNFVRQSSLRSVEANVVYAVATKP